MKSHKWLTAGLILVALVSGAWQVGRAAEPVMLFLQGLQNREMFDAAEMYLEDLRSSPNLDPETKKLLPYLEGKNFLEQAKALRDVKLKLKALDAAKDRFGEFVKLDPKSSKAPLANVELGNILVERANSLMDQSRKPANAAQKPQMEKEARDYFTQATKVFNDAVAQLEDTLKKQPPFIDPKKEIKKYNEREEIRSDYLLARIFAAQVIYTHAQAYDEKAPERKKLLTEGAEAFKQIGERFRQRLAGLEAIRMRGLCFQELGDYKQAMAQYTILLTTPADDPPIRRIQAKALRLAIMCQQKDKKWEDAIKKGEDWVKAANPQEERGADGLGIHMALGQTYKMYFDEDKDEKKKTKLKIDGAKHLRLVARVPGDFREDARRLLLDWGVPAETAEERNFENVFAAAKEALDFSQGQAKDAAAEKDAKKKEELEKLSADNLKKAFKSFQECITLPLESGERPPVDNINVARYFLSYLYFQQSQPYHAAVMAEYLARKYPETSVGRPASQLALAAYGQAYSQAPENDNQFEAAGMEGIAAVIVKNWPQEPEAASARLTLIDVYIRGGHVQKILDVLNSIDEKNPSRGAAEMKAGAALWNTNLRQPILPADQRLTKEVLDQIVPESRKLLETGLGRVPPNEEVSPSMARAELCLAQIYTREAEYAKSLKILESKGTGLLDLVAHNHEATTSPAFRSETYKAALRAYVGTQNGSKAEEMMSALEGLYKAQGPEKEAELTSFFLSMGREIKLDMDALQAANKIGELKSLVAGFEDFLVRISKREQGNDWKTLGWIGDTFYKLGQTAGSEAQLATEAPKYFANAEANYKTILGNLDKNPNYIPDEESRKRQVPRLRVQLAMCLRETGKYAEAIDAFKTILKDAPSTLNAQVEAAQVFQAWGKAQKDNKILFKAMAGAEPPAKGKSNLIWGWNQMAKVLVKYLETNPSFVETFHEARYNLAACYREMAQNDAVKRKDYLGKAESVITLTAQLYPTLGGDEQRQRYDDLLRRVQRELGKQADGLPNTAANPQKAAQAPPPQK